MNSKGMKIGELKCKLTKEIRHWDLDKFGFDYIRPLEVSKPISKDKQLSDKCRAEGNKLYPKKNLGSCQQHKILHLYNESIAYALCDSEELAMAYGNKAALLHRMRKYPESIAEADKALKITKSTTLRIKLLCRKAECYTAVGSSESRGCLEKARFILTKLEDADNSKEVLNDLVTKAQSVIANDKLDKPREFKRKTQALNLIKEAQRKNVLDSVKVAFSEKYGRHLVAARDFKPGEIVLIDKPYSFHLHDSKAYLFCYHCHKYLWTVVPCDTCSWRMFCSAECKTEALDQYHDMECSVITGTRAVLDKLPLIPFIINIFFKALKETGGISQLQAEIKSIDESEDTRKNDFPLDEKLLSFKNIYTLPVRILSKIEHQTCIAISLIALICIAKYSSILNAKYEFRELKKLLRDDTASFIAALLYKFNIIIESKRGTFPLINPAIQDTSDEEVDWEPRSSVSGENNFFIKATTVLTLIACLPNVGVCRTDGSYFVSFALEPIKAGIPVRGAMPPSIYDFSPKSERQKMHRWLYNSACDCKACTDDWPKILSDLMKAQKMFLPQTKAEIVLKLRMDMRALHSEYFTDFYRMSYPDIKDVSKIRSIVEQTWEHLENTMPSPMIISSVKLLSSMYQCFFSSTEINSKKACYVLGNKVIS